MTTPGRTGKGRGAQRLRHHHHPPEDAVSVFAGHKPVRSIRHGSELWKRLAHRILPLPIYRWLVDRWHAREYCPPVGWVRFGSLRRVTPLSRRFGWDRGDPIDRYYIERFLSAHASDIRGRVLEVAHDLYTRKYGGHRVSKSDVLHVVDGHPRATVVADLTRADHIPSATFDCIILTQVLQFIADPRAAIRTLHRILAPGGVVLATVAGISQIDRHQMDRWGDYWRFTSLSARRLFEDAFPGAQVSVEAHGNVLAAVAFLLGLASTELRQAELEYRDPDYEVLIAIRAAKPE